MNLSLTGKDWVDLKVSLMYICFRITLIRALRLVMPFGIILLEILHHLSLPLVSLKVFKIACDAIMLFGFYLRSMI